MKNMLYLAALLCMALFSKASAQEKPVFGLGELSKTGNHKGDVWLKELNHADSLIDCNIATATFAPGARLNWHIHPAGQILMVTEGTGYLQEKGKAIQVISRGDVVKCPPGIAHWHGAAPQSRFTYVAVSTNGKNNKTVWLQSVTEAEYKSAKQ